MGLIILVAFVGKGGACLLSARLSSESWHQSITIGTLMNTRGLIELIILNIGSRFRGMMKAGARHHHSKFVHDYGVYGNYHDAYSLTPFPVAL